MTLMILEILPLEAPISRIEVIISPRVRLALTTRWLIAPMNSAAWRACSAFLRVMEAISSPEAAVS